MHIRFFKRKAFLSLVFFFLIVISVKGQDNPVVDSLFDIADQLWQDDIDSAIEAVEGVYQIGIETSDTLAINSALDYLGLFMDRKGKYKKGIEYYKRSADLKKQTGDSSLSWTYGEMGYCYMILGQYQKAKEYMQLGIEIAHKYGQMMDVGLGSFRLGNIYHRSGDLMNAMDLYEKALHIGDSINDLFIIYQPLANLSDIQLYLKNNDKALALAERALVVADSLDDKRQISDANSRLGDCYKLSGEHKKAQSNYFIALEVSQSIEDLRGMQNSFKKLGDLSLEQQQHEEALKYYRSAGKLEVSNRIMKSIIDLCIANVYYELDVIDSSYFYAQRAYNEGKELNAPLQMYKPAHLLYKILKSRRLSSKALYYYEVYNRVKDSLSTEEFEKEVIRKDFSVRIATDSIQFVKDQEIKNLEISRKESELLSQRKQKLGFLGMGILGLIVSALAIYNLQQKKKANRIIASEKEEADKQRKRSDELLLNILPEETAQELKEKGHSDAQLIDQVTVLFTDFKGFTALSEKVTPKELVNDLHECFSNFDRICEKYGIEKIKTIGDAYMAAGGLPSPNTTHAQDVVNASIEMAKVIEKGKAKKIAEGLPFFEVRIGVNTGPVVAGIVGIKKFQYDIWGDTVNTASRMESNSEAGQINVSHATYELLKDNPAFHFESRGKIKVKGKGEIEMYFVKGLNE